MSEYLFTSESVSEGHPDKVADQISDAILDAVLTQDPAARVAAETLVNTGLCVLAGEISTRAHVNYIQIARQTIRRIGYNASELGFDAFTSAGLDGSSSWRFSGHLANMPLFYEFRDDGVTSQPATITGKYLDN